jgi:prolyl oligopeptidase
MYSLARGGAASLLLVGVTTLQAGDGQLKYPETKRVDQVDVYHGAAVPDPYRWLETDVRQSKEVAEWVTEQNKVTFGYLEAIPEREAIRRRLKELMNYERYSSPFKEGGRYYYRKNDGLQNQDVLYVMDSLDGPAKPILDPNKWSKDGTVTFSGLSFSDDGKYLAYAVAEAGSDWHTWRVVAVDSGRVLSDEIKWTKFGNTSWTKDGKGFFYSRYDEPAQGAKYQSLNLNQKIYYHRLGTEQSEDILVYCRPDHPEWIFGNEVSDDGRYLIISIRKGTDAKNRLVYRDLSEPYAMPIELIENFDNEFTFVGNEGPTFYFKTDLKAPKQRVIAIDTRKPGREQWKEIIPESQDALTSVSIVGSQFVGQYLKDARTEVKMYTMSGAFVREVKFPTIGTAAGFGGKAADSETFYSFSSFTTPTTIYRYDTITGQSKQLRESKVAFKPGDFEVQEIFYQSKDGTRAPMFLAHKKGIKLDGSNPTLLYGYGGFNIPMTPNFSVTPVAWMEMGGVYAVAILRGGGEYGEEWHRAGTKLKKQNVFDDFLSAAQWLIDNSYTRPDKLAIIGRSNGGLLVGAAMTQRPDLFGACLPGVGVMDMLRFNKFTAGRFWVDDYGAAENPEEFKALYAYSPYHNLKKGVRYPATLVTTADTDDRVVPGHSFKFAAALQAAHAGETPVLIRIETRAGHGAGKPTAKLIEEVADELAFLVTNLHIKTAAN